MSGPSSVSQRIVGEDPYAAWGLPADPNKRDKRDFALQFIPFGNLYPGTLFLLTGLALDREHKKFKVLTLLKAGVVLTGLEPVAWPIDAYVTKIRWNKAEQTQ